jgi:hypothetical protein
MLVTLLFALRLFPLTVAPVVTLGLVVPSFQLLEPRSIDEGTGDALVGLSICALVILFLGCWCGTATVTNASRVVLSWSQGAKALADTNGIAVVSVPAAPPLTLSGFAIR